MPQPAGRPLSAAHRASMEADPWFASMPRAQREGLLAAAELIHLRRGAMVFRQGEISLIDGSPRTHDATALSALDLLVVPHRAFAQQMQGAPFGRAIAALLAARVRGLYGLMEDATLRGLRARVARRLLALARGDATQSPEPRVSVALPQEALAMMLGITRQTLSKELNALAKDGVIALGYGRIDLLQPASLQQMGAG